jgi:hypothetical protein
MSLTRNAYLTKQEADEYNRNAIASLLADITRVQNRLAKHDRDSLRSIELEKHSLRCKQIRLVGFQRMLTRGEEEMGYETDD